MVAVRLAEEVDRTANLYELLSEGLVIEVIDVEDMGEHQTPEVTLGIRAPGAFRVDRVERMLKPRTSFEIGDEVAVRFAVLTQSEAEDMSLGEIDACLADTREAERMLAGQLSRLKLDKSKASGRGYRYPNNRQHHQWLMLIEEIDVVTEQHNSARTTCAQLRDVQKTKRNELNQSKREAFADHFVRLARETLSEQHFEELRSRANDLADAANSD